MSAQRALAFLKPCLRQLPAIIGVAIGSVTATYAPGAVFKIAFVIFATFISIRMLFGGAWLSLGTELPGRGPLAFYGFVTGLFSSLVGVSGGAVSNAVLTLYGRSMQQAVATSCNARKLEVQRMLEFFGQEAVARVVKASPRLHDPSGQ